MKQLKTIIPSLNQISLGSLERSRQISQQKTPLNEKLINRVFAVMLIKYTHKWASQFPDEEFIDEAKKVWAMDLSMLSADQLKIGLDTVIDQYPEWPPTVGQFKALCKVGEESRKLDQLALADRSNEAITKEERVAMMGKYASQLARACKGDL